MKTYIITFVVFSFLGLTLQAQNVLEVEGTARVGLRGDENVLLDLNSERNWVFRQLGTGASTALELASIGGGGNKNFFITTDGNVAIGTFAPDAAKLNVRTEDGFVAVKARTDRANGRGVDGGAYGDGGVGVSGFSFSANGSGVEGFGQVGGCELHGRPRV